MVEGMRGGICHAIHRHAKADNKYMKNYDKNSIFRREQLIWLGNVSKIGCK